MYYNTTSDAPSPPAYQAIPPVNPNYNDAQQHEVYFPTAPPEMPSEMPRQQSYYQYSAIPIPQQYIIKSNEPTRHFPVNAGFFLLGFVFPGTWCIGACCWKREHDKYEVFWRRLNIIMTWIFSILFILWVLVLITLMLEDDRFDPGKHGNNTGDLPKIPDL